MEAPRYRVVFRGELMPGADPADVRTRLAAMFKVDVSRVEPLFSGRKMVVKKDLSIEDAKRYRDGFRSSGAVAHIETAVDQGDRFSARRAPPPSAQRPPGPRLAQPSAVAASQPAGATLACPKCSTTLPENAVVCSGCGHQLKALAPKVLAVPRRAAAAPADPAQPGAHSESPRAAQPSGRQHSERLGGNGSPQPIRHQARPATSDEGPALATMPEPEPQPVPEPSPMLEPEPIPPAPVPITEPAPVETEPWTSPAVPDAHRTQTGPPQLVVSPATPLEIIGTSILASLLHLVVVGFFLGPRMVWGLIASQVSIDEERLYNEDLWLGIRIILFMLAGSAAAIIACLPLAMFLAAKGVTDPWPLAVLPLPFILGLAYAALMYSLTTHTMNRNGEEYFRPVFNLDEPASIFVYARQEWKTLLLGSAALCAMPVFFLVPLGLAFIFTNWFNRLEVDGYRYRLRFPWRLALVGSLMALPTLGLWTFFSFIPSYFAEILPTGYWQRITPRR